MKIKRLYLKILISCIGILFITISMILVLFMLTAGRSYKSYIDSQTLSKLQVFQVMVQETIDRQPDRPPADNPELLKLLNTYAALFDIKMWFTDPGERILLKTFTGPADMPRSGVHRQIHHDNGITLYHYVLRWIKYYAVIPIRSGDNGLRLHMFIDTKDPNYPEALFLMGLIAIGCVAALLVIPMASFITRRIKRLNRSAIEFSDGNLSVRTDIQGDDEIAELGDSFNLMADKLEKLIHNAKELTANVSHELRSPLARLRVSKELILDKLDKGKLDKNPLIQGSAKDDIRRYVDNMESDIHDLDTLVEHMLALSKMDYQELPLSPEIFSFAAFLEKELIAYQPMLQQKKLTLNLDIRGSVTVHQDKTLLKSVLSNLLDNAVKYTAPGSTIYLTASSPKGQGLEFFVTNPGTPLPGKDLDKLFDPFFRLGGQNAPGSGLGLTIARKHVTRCRGKISARNTPQGLCMSVNLP